MKILIGNRALSGRVLLAPMAGITDAPFRRRVRAHGVALAASEMVASGELTTGGAVSALKADVSTDDGLTAVQIAGREAAPMADAARIAEDRGAPIIDLNFGCPAKKVTSGWSGSALMRDLDHGLRLIEAVVAAVRVPVTLKMRLGWCDDSRNAADLARRAEAAGVAMIAVHGRTRSQFYRGAADWAAIRAVRESVAIPVIANGDVTSPETARAALALSGADGVMIGRGAQGRYWRPAEIEAALAGLPFTPPDAAARRAELIDHVEDIYMTYGTTLGVRIARKHIGWALAGEADGPALRAAVIREEDPDAVLARLAAGAEPEARRAA